MSRRIRSFSVQRLSNVVSSRRFVCFRRSCESRRRRRRRRATLFNEHMDERSDSSCSNCGEETASFFCPADATFPRHRAIRGGDSFFNSFGVRVSNVSRRSFRSDGSSSPSEEETRKRGQHPKRYVVRASRYSLALPATPPPMRDEENLL